MLNAPDRAAFRSAGFTLVELLVVLALGALAVAVVGSGGAQYLRRAVYHDTVRSIGAGLQRAQLLSSREGRDVVVSYDIEQRTLEMGRAGVVPIGDGLTVQWTALNQAAGAPDLRRPAIFEMNANGGAKGGEFIVSDGSRGVSFSVNWLLGSVVQRSVPASP